MKRKFLAIASIVSIAAVLVTANAFANSETDRQYALQSIAFLRAYDNVDGLFGDYVSVTYKDYFAKSGRFTVNDLSKADSLLLSSKLPYSKIIDDAEILGQLARATRSETILRTKVYKEGPRYRFTIDWLHSPRMDLMASETFMLQEPASGQTFGLPEIKQALNSALNRLVAKVPFIGTVTGRDNNSVTVNLGNVLDLKKGDELKIATLDEVKRHPLLKQIVDWRLSTTGRLQVEQVEEGIAFCRVVDEESGRRIAKYQKVVQMIPANVDAKKDPVIVEEDEPRESATPRLGWASMGLWVGSLGRDYSDTTGGKSGSGLMFGAKVEGQLWLTRDWFAELMFNADTASYSQSDISTGAPSVAGSGTASLVAYKISAGYTFFAAGDFFGPRGFVKLGYQSFGFSLPISTTEFTSPTTFSGMFLGLGGELPIRSEWGALLNLDFGIGTTGDQTGLVLTTPTGASAVSFFVGGYKQFGPKMRIRAGIEAVLTGADFADNGGTSISQRAIAVAPSLVYYF